MCQPIGLEALEAGLDGVLARSAVPAGNQELAWFPKTRRAAVVDTSPFDEWY